MMADKSRGSIIFISSIAGSRVLHPQEQCAYNASKAAVTQLAKSLAAEWAPHGIRVNTIAPGYMDTPLNREAQLDKQMKHWQSSTPMGRLGLPSELNGLAVFLASEAAAFVTGAHIYVDVSSSNLFQKARIRMLIFCKHREDTRCIEILTANERKALGLKLLSIKIVIRILRRGFSIYTKSTCMHAQKQVKEETFVRMGRKTGDDEHITLDHSRPDSVALKVERKYF